MWGVREDPLFKLCRERSHGAHLVWVQNCFGPGKVQTGVMTGCWKRKQTSLSSKGERSIQPKQNHCWTPSPSSKRDREPCLGVKPNKNFCKQARGGRWVWKLQFPEAVPSTLLRPDVIIGSLGGKKIILVELIVPWEEGCEEAAESKKTKYQQLVQDSREKGWTTWLFTVEVGCRRFPAQYVWNLLTKVGVRGLERKTAARRIGEAAERASCWLWHKREDTSWKPGGDGQGIGHHCRLTNWRVLWSGSTNSVKVGHPLMTSTSGPRLHPFEMDVRKHHWCNETWTSVA